MPLSYYYFKDRTTGSPPTAPAPGLTPRVDPLPDASNPVFNFSEDFIRKLQSIDPIRMAQAIPYISISTLDANGAVVTDFNTTFFQKSVNMDAINSRLRYSDRPEISLQSLNVSQDLAAGGGLLSWTNVTLSIKLHKPDYITNNSLVSMLFSGLPMRIVYGWTTQQSRQPTGVAPNDVLGQNELLLFNVRDYTINFDVSGEGLLTINGMAHGDTFANVFVGDTAQEITQADVNRAAHDSPVTNTQQGNLFDQVNRVNTFVSYVNAMPSRQSTQATRSKAVMNAMTQAYYNVAERASSATKQAYTRSMRTLAQRKSTRTAWFKDVKKKNKDGTTTQGAYVTVHDVISILCAPTLTALQGKVIPANRDYRVVYGCFNENAGTFANQCLGNFPIHWNTFQNMLAAKAADGMPVPSLQFVFQTLVNDFLSDNNYWKQNLIKTDNQDNIDLPAVSCHVSSHFADSSQSATGGRREVVQIAFFDVNQKVPLTQLKIRSLGPQFTEEQQIAACVGTPPAVPVIRFGAANSFIKSISMESFADPTYKAMLMNRNITVSSTRQSLVAGATAPPPVTDPPFIPFKGSMELMGHVNWKPARFFYLASGIFFIDGVYVINKVQHQLDSSGYSTHIEFMRH